LPTGLQKSGHVPLWRQKSATPPTRISLKLSGNCRHVITGRSGVFEDTEGVFTMFDVITNVTGAPVTGEFAAGSGGNNFLYSGRIGPVDTSALVRSASELSASAESRSPMAASVAIQKARSGRSC
jgi:hypothetical protein